MTRWSPPDRLLLLLPAKKPEEPPLRLSSSFVRPQHQGRSLQRLLHHRNLLQWTSISGAGKSRSGSDGQQPKDAKHPPFFGGAAAHSGASVLNC
jgi:hypothetical protein